MCAEQTPIALESSPRGNRELRPAVVVSDPIDLLNGTPGVGPGHGDRIDVGTAG